MKQVSPVIADEATHLAGVFVEMCDIHVFVHLPVIGKLQLAHITL